MEKSLNTLLLGQRLRTCRLSRHQTMKELSEDCNISERYLADIERGLKAPKSDTLVRIANTLEVSLDYLLQDSLVGADKGNVTLNALNTLPPKQRELLQDFIFRLAESMK